MQQKQEIAEKSLRNSPVFNGKYELVKNLGKGKTAKVYLVRDVEEPQKQFALKLIRHKYLLQDKKHIHNIEKEIEILKGLTHENIVTMSEYGCEGRIVKSSQKEIKNQVYILTEYLSGGTLFDLVDQQGPLGEIASHALFSQLLETMSYMHQIGVVHRDIKLENILLDSNLNVKLADFGFATYKNVSKLNDFKGTKTYMAPEIKE